VNAPWARVKAIFLDALEAAPADRAEIVRRAAGGDAALAAEVESLLRSHAAAGDLLELPATASSPHAE